MQFSCQVGVGTKEFVCFITQSSVIFLIAAKIPRSRMADRKSESGSKSTLEIILEFGHKAILKDVPVQVGLKNFCCVVS